MKLKLFYLKIFVFIFLTLGSVSNVLSQITNVDSSFQIARTLAFATKYSESITICKMILNTSPEYQDVRVLLGRVYFWDKKKDSAIFVLSEAIKLKPYEDAYIALSDIFRWTKAPQEALKISNDGLLYFPNSIELFLRKIKALTDLDRNKEAYTITDSLILSDKNNELRQVAESLKNKLSKNILSVSYDYDYFDKQFKDPWHLFSIGYGRQTKHLGKVTSRLNLGNRFSSNGSQFEIDAYPTLGKKMYAYVNAGYSPNNIFPNYRSGISVYRNFKFAFEGEVGIRILYFTKATILYVGSIGKYKGNFWFSLRPTFIASNNGNRFSQSYSFITRYYLKNSFDFLTLTIGYGLSPDDRSRETLFQNPDYKSLRINFAIQKIIRGNNVFSISAGIIRGEYFQGGKNIGNNIFSGITYQKMF